MPTSPADDAPANFERVDSRLWRGGRPTIAQAHWLFDQGMRSVVNLELFLQDVPSFVGLDIEYRHLPDWEPIALFDPKREDAHLQHFLGTLDTLPPPTFVHCRDGQNRTGLAVAAYRLAVLHTPIDDVIADMERFRGLWEVPDAHYLRGFATRFA